MICWCRIFHPCKLTDTEHVTEIPHAEKEVKYEYLQKWMKETLDYTCYIGCR